jgi:hypothetical protein
MKRYLPVMCLLSWSVVGSHADVLYDNGPFITEPDGGFNNAARSTVQAPSVLRGVKCYAGNSRLADDFTVPPGQRWRIDAVTVYMYQPADSVPYGFPPASPIYQLNLMLYDAPPNQPPFPEHQPPDPHWIAGDYWVNVLAETGWTGAYRVPGSDPGNDTRPIMYAKGGILRVPVLSAGTYWICWGTLGAKVSGPYSPPVTPAKLPGDSNARVYEGGIQHGAWSTVYDPDLGQNHDFPFRLEGARLAVSGDMDCDGVINFDDINPFVLALSDPVGYQNAYPACNILNADCNDDGAVNFDDINPFVAILSR